MAQAGISYNRGAAGAARNQGRYLPVAEANAIMDGRLARRRGLSLFYAAGLLAVLAAVSHAAFNALADAPALQIARIRIDGLNGSLRQEIETATKSFVQTESSLLALDTDSLRTFLEKNPLVGDLRFEKHFPSTLVINAVQREPAALLSAGGFFLVDKEGRVMHKLEPADLPKYDFPFFTGLPANDFQRGEKIYSKTFSRAVELCRLLRDRDPALYALVSEINLGGGDSSGSHQEQSMTAHLKGGAEVRLGDRSAAEILPAFDLFLQILNEQKEDIAELAYVDLRYKDRIFYMDRTTFLASASGVLEEAERLAAEEAAKQKKTHAKASAKTKRLEPASKASNNGRSNSSPSSSRTAAIRR